MSKKLINTTFIYLLILLSFFALYAIDPMTQKPRLIIDPQDEVVNLNPHLLQTATFGQQRLIASLLWSHTILRSDLKHYKEMDLNSWMYLRINTITTLAPFFYEAYYIGSQYLSIVKDDDQGAKDIYDKALEKFPNDHKLLYGAGFHHFYELGNREVAIGYFERAIENGNTIYYLPSLVARMKAEGGELLAAKRLIEANLKLVSDNEAIKSRLSSSLYAINAELDLKCLNSGENKNVCSFFDQEGKPYIKKGTIYVAPRPWKKFRIQGKKLLKNKKS